LRWYLDRKIAPCCCSDYILCNESYKRCFTWVLHLQRWKITRWLHQIQQTNYFYGNAKKNMNDYFPI
jgi:hypothetical protein